jgi:hypothetical protein
MLHPEVPVPFIDGLPFCNERSAAPAEFDSHLLLKFKDDFGCKTRYCTASVEERWLQATLRFLPRETTEAMRRPCCRCLERALETLHELSGIFFEGARL